MTINWTKILSNLRTLVMCFAVIAYGLPTMTMASSDMMAAEISIDCDAGMTDHADADMSCYDTGDCDYSCTGPSMAITNMQTPSMEIPRQSHADRFINRLVGVDPASDSPPPQA